ncbi:PilN domain-containing protein [Anaerosinus massiliensis]|uniref:PilN domain-containing protein n=1 Tax=Massilibacillus massiliensis TaxID=1806837 RepID=UPI000DA6256D|nr:PilN domain-containing protein [Massilibacillus massiliensis]
MIKINLLPPEKRCTTYLMKNFFIKLVFLTILLCFFVYVRGEFAISTLRQHIKSGDEQYTLLNHTVERKNRIEADVKQLEIKNDILAGITSNTISKYAILVHLSNVVVENVWLTELQLKETNLVLKGNAYNYKSLAAFLRKLEEDVLFKNVSLITSENKTDVIAGADVTTFEIMVYFKEF